MKKLLLLTALVAITASCGKTGYTVQGNITGLDATTIYLMDANDSSAPIDSVTMTEGKFEFAGVIDTPRVVLLKAGNFITPFFVLENAKITVAGDASAPGSISATGAEFTDAFNALNMAKDSVSRLNNTIYEQINDDNRDSLMNILRSQSNVVNADLPKAFLAANPANPASAQALLGLIHSMSAEEIMAAYNGLQSPAKESPAATKARDHAEAMMATAIGKKFIEISAKNAEGKEITLSETVKANKYTLLDFWAAWCGPCMAEMPYLLADYEKYHSKGFEVYGYSLDNNREQWVNTSNETGIGWINVSDLKYWQAEPAAKYAVRAIPANFLIDSEGTIIAKNLRGKALEEKLSELLD